MLLLTKDRRRGLRRTLKLLWAEASVVSGLPAGQRFVVVLATHTVSQALLGSHPTNVVRQPVFPPSVSSRKLRRQEALRAL